MPAELDYTFLRDRVDAIEATTVPVWQYEAEARVLGNRLAVLEDTCVAYFESHEPGLSFSYEALVNEVLARVVEIIEKKSNWVFSPPEDEFNSGLEGLF